MHPVVKDGKPVIHNDHPALADDPCDCCGGCCGSGPVNLPWTITGATCTGGYASGTAVYSVPGAPDPINCTWVIVGPSDFSNIHTHYNIITHMTTVTATVVVDGVCETQWEDTFSDTDKTLFCNPVSSLPYIGFLTLNCCFPTGSTFDIG